MRSKLKELGSHTIIYGSGLIISKALGFLMIPVYAKNLSISEYGVIALLDFTVNIFTLVIGCNINDALLKYYNDADELNVKPSAVISTAVLSVALISFFGCFLLTINSFSMSKIVFGSGQYSYCFKIVFITMFFELLLNIPLQYMRILNKSKYYASINIFRTVASLITAIILVLYYRMGVLGVLYTNLIINSFFCLLLLYWLKANISIEFSKKVAKELLAFSLPLIPAGVAATCLQSADVFILKQMSNEAQVGIYSFGYKFGMLLGVVVQTPFMLVWGPIAYRVIKEVDGPLFIAKVLTYYNIISVYFALIVAVFSKEIIELMADKEYYNAANCVPFVLLGYVFFGMAGIFHLGILANKQTKRSMYITLSTASINIVLNVVLISYFNDKYKYIAPAISTAISFFILALLRSYYSSKYVVINYEYSRIINTVFISVLLYFVSTIYITDLMIVSIFIKIGIVASFPILLLIANVFDTKEIEFLKTAVKNKITC